MISAREAALAITAAKENTDLVVFGTMMFDEGPRGWFSMMGDTPESGVKDMLAAGADVVGANCGNGVEKMVELAAGIRAATDGFDVDPLQRRNTGDQEGPDSLSRDP